MQARPKREDIERQAAMMLVISSLAAARDRHSPQWCRNRLIGPILKFLVSPPRDLPPGVIRFPSLTDLARQEAITRVGMLCRTCGQCDLARG